MPDTAMPDTAIADPSERSARRLGLAASSAALAAVVGYGAAQIAQVAGALSYPLADILIFAASLCISAPYLAAMIALAEVAEPGGRLWMRGALAFGAIYVGYVALMYTVQLATVLPRSPRTADTGVLGVLPQSLFWDIDALGYIAMGLSALFAGLALDRSGPQRWPRRFLLAHGALTPVIAFVYFYPHYGLAVLLLGSPWLVTAAGSMAALALYFRSGGKAAFSPGSASA